MTDIKRPRKPATETADQLMNRIKAQPIDTRVSVFELIKAHLIEQKQQAEALSKSLNGLK